jgi:hypothetical protein
MRYLKDPLSSKMVLLLNKNWFPLEIISLRRAFCNLLNKRSIALNHNDYNPYEFDEWVDIRDNQLLYIRTRYLNIPVPEIIISRFYGGVPKFGLSSSRKNILKRDKYTCQYSGEKLCSNEATIDHIVPKSKGGDNSWKNCVTSSFIINNKKSDKQLGELDLSLIREPFVPKNNILYRLPFGCFLPESWHSFLFKKTAINNGSNK